MKSVLHTVWILIIFSFCCRPLYVYIEEQQQSSSQGCSPRTVVPTVGLRVHHDLLVRVTHFPLHFIKLLNKTLNQNILLTFAFFFKIFSTLHFIFPYLLHLLSSAHHFTCLLFCFFGISFFSLSHAMRRRGSESVMFWQFHGLWKFMSDVRSYFSTGWLERHFWQKKCWFSKFQSKQKP